MKAEKRVTKRKLNSLKVEDNVEENGKNSMKSGHEEESVKYYFISVF